MRLGICVVYLVQEESEPLLELHLRQIRRCTTVPYTLYASANRLLPRFRERIERERGLVVCAMETTDRRSVAEHSYYLDGLLAAAVADGATRLVTLHVDSFPVRTGWVEKLETMLSPRCPAAAVLRRENGDRFLPFHACLYFTREFYERCQPRFLTPPEVAGAPAYRRYAARLGNVTDSGVGFGFALHRNGLTWHPLLRSNRHDDHYLLAGIYGDLVFHLGAAARAAQRAFRGDRRRVPLAARPLWWLRRGIRFRPLRRLLRPVFRSVGDRNEEAFAMIRSRLFADPDGYLERLRSGGAAETGPDLPARE
jgi:hypothetical protein